MNPGNGTAWLVDLSVLIALFVFAGVAWVSLVLDQRRYVRTELARLRGKGRQS